ncbi:MAG: type IV toxin-antitoxin system AbiEi family antitoxin domain-containing protein [Nanobdellota archaeon]
MEGLSKKEVEIISSLEFDEKYFFKSEDVERLAENETQKYNIIKNLIKKERIVKINRNKYYLIPIKARKGKWTENPFIVADEIFDGDGYFVGGWAAANYWRLTNQIPMQYDIWTTKRQGVVKILGIRFKFHRTTKNRTENAVTEYIKDHPFRIQSKEDTKEWLSKR